VAVKMPLPDDKVEALTPTGSKSKDASNGSAASAAFDTFIAHSLQP
jgi:hypothetical protein